MRGLQDLHTTQVHPDVVLNGFLYRCLTVKIAFFKEIYVLLFRYSDKGNVPAEYQR